MDGQGFRLACFAIFSLQTGTLQLLDPDYGSGALWSPLKTIKIQIQKRESFEKDKYCNAMSSPGEWFAENDCQTCGFTNCPFVIFGFLVFY